VTWPEVPASEIVAKAREYLGTPYHDGARVKGIGVDCIGLVVCTFKELGVPVTDKLGHTKGDQIEALESLLRLHCNEAGNEQPGDILLFRYRSMYHHAAIASPEGMIHSYDSPAFRKVIEHPISPTWRVRLHGIYRYRGAI
jgi:NlpC/P60 family putative phage cell wall peptidase